VRDALGHAFDFEWTNTSLFYGAYVRTESYFANSKAYHAPSTESGGIRPNLLRALGLLNDAGWVVRDLRLVRASTGQPMTFEILLDDPTWERIALPFVENLERLGVSARVRSWTS
jgi:microcin C transport system substrate-binding protein